MSQKPRKTEVAIELKGVTKEYILHHEKPTFSEKIMRRGTTEKFTALENLDLTIYKGEKIGIIGRNGSGKTTLLKIIAGITTPSSGSVITKGKIVSLIDLEAGFHPDLTGEENIFLNGLVIGMSKKNIKARFKSIVDFSGLKSFIDVPFYTYSEGMKLRLAFSVAVHSNPKILLIDEGISVGDKEFREKGREKLKEMMNQSLTVITVTQIYAFLEDYVEHVYVLEAGKLVKSGDLKMARQYFTATQF